MIDWNSVQRKHSWSKFLVIDTVKSH